jgi:hypothetical protein
MRTEIKIIFFNLFLCFVSFFLIFNYNYNHSLTGFATGNFANETNFSVAKEDAFLVIEESEAIIKKLESDNFPVIFMNDTLLEAKNEFERAKYADILRNSSSSPQDIAEARVVLKLVNWKDINYSNVLVYTNKIKERRAELFLIFDLLIAEENKILDAENAGINVSDVRYLFNEANKSFYEERYGDAKTFLDEAENSLELEKEKMATGNLLKAGARNFIQRYWHLILLFLILFGAGILYLYKKFTLNLLKKKIKKLNIEMEVILDLMKKSQIERFESKIIPEIVYNIRMEKFKKRMSEIKEILPVLASKITDSPQQSSGIFTRFFKKNFLHF